LRQALGGVLDDVPAQFRASLDVIQEPESLARGHDRIVTPQEIVSPPSSISSQGQNTFGFDVKADNIEQDTTTQLQYRVRGSFEDGKECYYSDIESSESLSIKGDGVSDEPSYMMGWFCKDSDTLGLRWPDGSWTDEIGCRNGCYGGKCDDSGFTYSTSLNSLQKTEKTSQMPQFGYGFLEALLGYLSEVFVFPGEFPAYFGISTVFGVIVIGWLAADEIAAYIRPAKYSWDYDNLHKHYNKHGHEFGNISKEEYARICQQTLNSKASTIYQQKNPKWSGDHAAFNPVTGVYVPFIAAKGKIASCFRPDYDPTKTEKENIDNAWKQVKKWRVVGYLLPTLEIFFPWWMWT